MISPVKTWRRQNKIKSLLGNKGKVIAFTKIHVTSKDYKHGIPYVVVIVEFNNKKRAVGQFVDWEDAGLKIGISVIAILRRVQRSEMDGIITYGVKFKPIRM